MLVYTPEINTRVEYVFRTIFEDIWNSSVQLTNNLQEFQNYTGPKLNYSIRRLGGELFIESHQQIVKFIKT